MCVWVPERFPYNENRTTYNDGRASGVDGAEGAARNSPRELFQYLGIASGSLAELETQLELANRLGLGQSVPGCRRQVSLVGKLLVGIRRACRLRIE